jgi:hypothetical protein
VRQKLGRYLAHGERLQITRRICLPRPIVGHKQSVKRSRCADNNGALAKVRMQRNQKLWFNITLGTKTNIA